MPLPELPARERLGRRRLHERTVLGRTLDPEGTVSAGFLDELTAPGELESVAQERGREIAALSVAAYLGTLASVWGSTLERIRALVDEQARHLDAARAG